MDPHDEPEPRSGDALPCFSHCAGAAYEARGSCADKASITPNWSTPGPHSLFGANPMFFTSEGG